jgi:carboxyl-terminal processing protease
MPLEGGAGLRLTVARYYTPLGRMIHKNFKAKDPNKTGGIVPDMQVAFNLSESRKATMYMTNLLYSPSQKTILPEESLKAKDIVLDRAVEILKARKSLSALVDYSTELQEQAAKEQEEKAAEKQEDKKEETNQK